MTQLAQSPFPLSMIRSDGYGGTETLLFLIAIILGDLSLEQDAIRFVFGFNVKSRDFLFKRKEKHRDVVSSVNEESERSGCGFAGLRLIRPMRTRVERVARASEWRAQIAMSARIAAKMRWTRI